MDLNKIQVLIVDDARVAREILRNMLKEMGITNVVQAGDGKEATDRLAEGRIDLVLSDWNMPGMSGLDLLRHMRASTRLQGIPFIMVTAERMQDNIIQAVQEGVTGYIKKPFGALELQKKYARRYALNDVRSMENRISWLSRFIDIRNATT